VPAGEYAIGVLRNGGKAWTIGLNPGQLGRRDTPDMSKSIRLDSIFSDSKGTAEHMVIDINAGSDLWSLFLEFQKDGTVHEEDQSPERSDGTTCHSSKSCDTFWNHGAFA
jgi:hypothetical protein